MTNVVSNYNCVNHELFSSINTEKELQKILNLTFPKIADYDNFTWEQKKNELRSNYLNCISEEQKKQERKLLKEQLKKMLSTAKENVFNIKTEEEAEKFFNENQTLAENLIKSINQAGGSSIYGWYFYFNPSSEETILGVVKNIIADFQTGIPYSLSTMALFLSERKINKISLTSYEPFKDIPYSLKILQRLAFIGVREAGNQLSSIYCYDKIGVDDVKEKINLEIITRIDGLRQLAESGNDSAQHELGLIFYHNKIDDKKLQFTVNERIEFFENLFKNEKKHQFYITEIFESNLIGEIDYKFTKAERLFALNERAYKGDEASLCSLLRYYLEGYLGKKKQQIQTDLTIKERFGAIYRLKPINPRRVNAVLSTIYSNPFCPLHAEITKEETKKWFLSEAFDANNFQHKWNLQKPIIRYSIRIQTQVFLI